MASKTWLLSMDAPSARKADLNFLPHWNLKRQRLRRVNQKNRSSRRILISTSMQLLRKTKNSKSPSLHSTWMIYLLAAHKRIQALPNLISFSSTRFRQRQSNNSQHSNSNNRKLKLQLLTLSVIQVQAWLKQTRTSNSSHRHLSSFQIRWATSKIWCSSRCRWPWCSSIRPTSCNSRWWPRDKIHLPTWWVAHKAHQTECQARILSWPILLRWARTPLEHSLSNRISKTVSLVIPSRNREEQFSKVHCS